MNDVHENRTHQLSVETCRHFFAEEIRVIAGVRSQALASAFERVPRERFVGPPPWHIASGLSLREPSQQSTSEVRDLYHDVLIALKEECALNNGQPSLLAKLIDALELAPGKRVVHVGCGTGYYTAIMAELVGPQGSVVAIEIDPELAQRSAANLQHYPQVNVLSCDAASVDPGPCDAILINAGFVQPHRAWLTSLRDSGVIVIPILVGRSERSGDAMAFRVQRRRDGFRADPLTILTIYPSPSLRDPATLSIMNAAFESHSLLRTHSLRIDPHSHDESCVVHAASFCLSSKRADELA